MKYLSLRIDRTTISIEVPAEIEDWVRNTVFSAIIRPEKNHSKVDYRIRFRDDRWELFRYRSMTHRNRTVEKIFYALEWQVVNDLIRMNPDALKFHAAALSRNGEGWLFIGGSGYGKTSLSIFLMKHGWNFLSDEFGWITPDSLEMIPFPRNLIIKPHIAPYVAVPADLPSIPLYRDDYSKYSACFLSPTLLGNIETEKTIPLKHIFLLNPNRTNAIQIERFAQNRAFIKLCSSLFNYRGSAHFLTDVGAKILQQAPVYQLSLPNPLALSESEGENLIKILEGNKLS
ncbi:MAG: hypothetical protein COT43_06605 [Candidatus Marinimicrobia bacterium CG08_land_8_20_14_0_20_45_22]|nr:MAG: hypothetical protein COT43_06605 [Candidatus Marinimicrobia bacterium CG08_land_8_20_14_0_20_45_22]